MAEAALSQSEEEQVIERIVRNQLAIKELEEQNATLKAYFKTNQDAYPVGSNKTVGKFYVKASRNARIDNALAFAKLPARVFNSVSKKVVDTKAANAVLDPEQLASITKEFDPKIEVGLV